MSAPAETLVACLCAQWCGACRAYRATFDSLSAQFGQHAFLWIDIEDEAELMGAVDVENFPTLLIVRGAAVRFFGTVTPHRETAERLLHAAAGGDGDMPQLPADVRDLVRRLRDRATFTGERHATAD
jgi:thiol-disulfide isomerase/thioredoxin